MRGERVQCSKSEADQVGRGSKVRTARDASGRVEKHLPRLKPCPQIVSEHASRCIVARDHKGRGIKVGFGERADHERAHSARNEGFPAAVGEH